MSDAALHDIASHDIASLARQRHYGKYRGTVTNTDATTMRVQATVPAVLGPTPSGWALPCVPYAGKQVGFVMLPDIGTNVWIEFEGGDPSYPIWTGCFWSQGDIPASAAVGVNSIVTAAGKLTFDDAAGSITLQDGNGDSLLIQASQLTLASGPDSIAMGSGVNVNNGALQVT